jgi:hypothetical protein
VSDRPPYALLLDWMNDAVALAPTTEPYAADLLWLNSGVLQLSPGKPLSISSQPTNQSALDGATATFSLTAVNATGYQWQKQESGAGAWANVSGATSASYTTGTLTVADDDTDKYRCVVTNPVESLTSSSVALTVTLALPSDAIGIWYAENYVTSPRKGIPNAAIGSTLDANILTAPRRQFSTSNGFYNRSGTMTVTDSNAVAPDGSNDATTAVWGNSDGWIYGTVSNMPAGTYTLVMDIKTTDSATVNVKMGVFNSEEIKSVNGTWASYSVTFTRGSLGSQNLTFVRANNATTPANLAICNARLFSGSSDIGATSPRGDMLFGSHAYDSMTTVSGGKWTPDSSLRVIQLPARTMTAWTILGCVQRTSDNTYWQAMLGSVGSPLTWTPLLASSNAQKSGHFISNTERSAGAVGLWTYENAPWHVIGYTYDGTTLTAWINGAQESLLALASASVTITDLWDCIFNNTGFPRFDFNSTVVWARCLSNSEMSTAFAVLKGRANTQGFTVGNPRFVCAEGDSITNGSADTNTFGYARRFAANSNPRVNGCVRASNGASMTTLSSRAATTDAIIPTNKRGIQYVLSVLIGANDLGGITGSTYAATVGAYTAARKSAGWDKVVLCTCTPRSGNATFTTNKNAYNAVITGTGWAAANGVDAICDFAADATIGPDAAASDAVKYPDGLHPSASSHVIMETIYRSVINGL